MLYHTKRSERYLLQKGILYYSYVENLDADPQFFQLVARAHNSKFREREKVNTRVSHLERLLELDSEFWRLSTFFEELREGHIVRS